MLSKHDPGTHRESPMKAGGIISGKTDRFSPQKAKYNNIYSNKTLIFSAEVLQVFNFLFFFFARVSECFH